VAVVAGAAAFLLARLAPDVGDKPLFEDEAVAGLIGARPPWEIVVTTMWDRGGAPGHFLLAHLAFLFEPSAEALRWLSVVFALATVALCYDLGRRLDSRVCGVVAAIVAAASGMLAVYGSFGRMYALLAFAGALAADLFVRALDERTTGAAIAAAAGAWLLPAVHPYGGLVVGIEALVALALWRGRPLKPALPVAAIGLAVIPFAVADLRLATRFEVTSSTSERLASPEEAGSQLLDALRGFAGGAGWTLVVFILLAVAGAVLLVRRRASFVVWGVTALVLPPLLAMLVETGRAADLSPRHLAFALPFWAACIATAVARIPVPALAVAGIAVLAVVSPQGIYDPRSITYTAALGTEEAVAAPASYLRRHIEEGDALYPYSSVFLAALPEAGRAVGLPRGQSQSLLAAVGRLEYPVPELFVAIPSGDAQFGELDVPAAVAFPSWIVARSSGPFPDEPALLQAAYEAIADAHAALIAPRDGTLGVWFDLNEKVLCESLMEHSTRCGTQ
jgi:hypothetical protein